MFADDIVLCAKKIIWITWYANNINNNDDDNNNNDDDNNNDNNKPSFRFR